MNGFLGTRAGGLSDLLLISLLVIAPAGLLGYYFARRRRGAAHRVVMLTTYSVVAVFVVIYIIHNFVEGFPPIDGDTFSVFNLVYFAIGLVHSVLASLALYLGGRQLYTGYTYTAGNGAWVMPGERRALHAAAGRRTLFVFLAAAVTGALFYTWVFVVVM